MSDTCQLCDQPFEEHDVDSCVECGSYYSYCQIEQLFKRDPALKALRTLGKRAVPQLCVKCMRDGQ